MEEKNKEKKRWESDKGDKREINNVFRHIEK